MEKLKSAMVFIGTFILRLALVTWLSLLLRLVFVKILGGVTLLHAAFVVVLTVLLHLTKADSIFLVRHMDKRNFSLFVYVGYSLFWVLWFVDHFTGYADVPSDRGLGGLLLALLIAPISEILHGFVFGMAAKIFPNILAIQTSPFHIDLFIRILLSFAVLHLLLRFIKWCVFRSAQTKN